MSGVVFAGDICWRRKRPTQGCRANNDNDDNNNDDNNNNNNDDDDDDDGYVEKN